MLTSTSAIFEELTLTQSFALAFHLIKMTWFVGTSGTRSRWLFPLVLVQFWLFVLMLAIGYFITLPSRITHERIPGALRITSLPKVLYSADFSMFGGDCRGVITFLDLANFPMAGLPVSAQAILIKPIPMFEYCSIGAQQRIPTAVTMMLEPICRITKPINGTTSSSGQIEFNLCQLNGPPGLYSLQFEALESSSDRRISISQHIRMISPPYRLKLNDEAPAMLEPACNSTVAKKCATGPQNAQIFFGNLPVPGARIVLTATHVSMLPYILGVNMTVIRAITRWPALSMLSYGAAMLSDSEALSDSLGFVNFSKLNILGYTTPTISLAVYFGGRLQLWSGVKRLDNVFWVRESAIRREFSARMNAPCVFTTLPAASNDLITLSPGMFLRISGKFCTYRTDSSGMIETNVAGRIGFFHIVPSFDIAVLDSGRSREYFKHPWNASTSVSRVDGSFTASTKFTSDGRSGIYTLYFIADGQIMLSKKLFFAKTAIGVASFFLPRSVQGQMLQCKKSLSRADACYYMEPFSSVIGAEYSPSIRLTQLAKVPQLIDSWHVGIADMQARLYFLPVNFTESLGFSAPNFQPNALSFLSQDSGVISFPEVSVSHLRSSQLKLQYFAEQTKIKITPVSNSELPVECDATPEYSNYMDALQACNIPSCAILQVTKTPRTYSTPYPSQYPLMGVLEDLDIGASIFNSSFALQTSDFIVICAIFIKRHLWESGLSYPSNSYQGSRVCNKNSPTGWSSSRSRPSILSSFRYVLEPGEYVWFLQADATLTNALIQSQYQNQTFFFEGSSNFSQFLVQGRPSPMCRNAVAMAEKAYQKCKSNFYFGSFGARIPTVQFDGSIGYAAMVQPSLDFVDLYSTFNGAMRNMDAIPWWRAEMLQTNEVYFQVNDYILAGEGDDPVDNPISGKPIRAEDRGRCDVLYGSIYDIGDLIFSKTRNPAIPSGSVNDFVGYYFYFAPRTFSWRVPTYSLVQCSVNGVQSPILELYPTTLRPTETYQGCGDYPGTLAISESTCTSRSTFVIDNTPKCLPIGLIIPNITVSIQSPDGGIQLQGQQFDLSLLDVDINDSVIAAPFNIVRLNANKAQISGLKFSYIRAGDTYLRVFVRGVNQRDIFMRTKKYAPAPDELVFQLETGSSVFVIGAPASPFLWKVSLISNCFLEGANEGSPWVPPAVQLFVAICHGNVDTRTFNTLCHISNDISIDSNVVFQSQLLDTSFQLEANVRLVGGSPEISQNSWRLVAKTVQRDQVVWISDQIQISFGTIALKVLPSFNGTCFVGARCIFELKVMNPFGIPVPGATVTVVNNNDSIRNFSFSPVLHAAVSDCYGMLSVFVEFSEDVIGGGIAVIGLIAHDADGTRYITTKNVTVVNIVDSVINVDKLDFTVDSVSTTLAPSFHFRSNQTALTFFGTDTRAFLLTTEAGKDNNQFKKPTFYILDSLGNNLVVLQSESSVFLTDWKGEKVENSTSILEASTPVKQGDLVFKFEYIVVNRFVPSGFYKANFCFMGNCVQADFEFFVRNTLLFDDSLAELIFALTILMAIVVFLLLPWSFHSDRPDKTAKRKAIAFFIFVLIATALQTRVELVLKAKSLANRFLTEFDLVVTVYSILVPVTICICSFQAFYSFYDARFNSSEDAFRTNEQLAIRLITGAEKTMRLIRWCQFTITKLKKFQADRIEQKLISRPKRQFRHQSFVSMHTIKVHWSSAMDRFAVVALAALTLLAKATENFTPYETTAFQKVSEYISSPRLLMCFLIPIVMLPLLLFLVRVGVRMFQGIIYNSVTLVSTSNVSWLYSSQKVSIDDFFNDASATSCYTGRSLRQLASDSILDRIMLYFSQIVLSRDVQMMHDFLYQFAMSANTAAALCVIATMVGFLRFFMVYRGYVHTLRERGRRVLIDSKINFAMHKSSSLVPGQFWSTLIGFFVAFLVFMLISMIARWEPLKKYLANSVINPLVVALVLHYVAVAISRISDALFVPNLSSNSLWMPRRRLFSLYEFIMTIFAWISAAGSMIFRFAISAASWLCLAPMDFFQQKSLDFKSTDQDVAGSDRFIAAIGVDHVVDSPLTATTARLLIQNIDNYLTRTAFDKSQCDPLAIRLELKQYESRDQRRFLLSRWSFLINMSSGTQAAADIKVLRKPFVGATYNKLPVTGFGSTQNYWDIVKMDPGIRDWLRQNEKPEIF